MPNFLLYEQQGHVVTLTMNEPERRNPLTGNSAVPDFLAAIDRIHNDSSVRAVILTGAGTAFSSGGDIRDMERQASGRCQRHADPPGIPHRHPASAACPF